MALTKKEIQDKMYNAELTNEEIKEYLEETYTTPKQIASVVAKYNKLVSDGLTDLIFNFEIIGYTALNVGGVEVIADTDHLAVGYTTFDKIYVNALYADTFDLTKEHIKFLIAHEVFHIILLTKQRYTEDKDARLWNQATDYAINQTLIEDEQVVVGKSVGQFIKFGLYEPAYKYMSAEQIYKKLVDDIKQQQKQKKQQGQQQNNNSGQSNSDDEQMLQILQEALDELDKSDQDESNSNQSNSGNESSEEETESKKHKFILDEHLDINDPKVKEAVDEAVLRTSQIIEKALAQGTLSQGMQRFLDSIPKDVKEDWRAILNNYLRSFKKAESSWKRPNKRYLANEVYFPNRYNTPNLNVAIGIDTSASIGEEELAKFFAHINKIMKSYKTFNIKIFCWSTRVHKDTLIELNEKTYKDFKVKDYFIQSGGGTDIYPTLEYLKEMKDKPDVGIVLTDGYFTQDEAKFDKYPLVFGIIGSYQEFNANKGIKRAKVIHIKD